MNAVILTSVISAGNHALFAGARVVYGLSAIGQAPRIFLNTNRNGVPWVAVLAVASVSLIFFGASFLPGGAGQIWSWAQNLVGVSRTPVCSNFRADSHLSLLPSQVSNQVSSGISLLPKRR
jgi:AAT family amino acid transporter